ncbi:hypothetical protein KGQ20_45605, partial [Catenulispora sp. NF23]|nr:hypothetical protein [Catenulispora pinistramenti]
MAGVSSVAAGAGESGAGETGDVPDEALGANFTCAAALVHPNGTEHVVEGVATGHLIRAPRG